MLLQRNSQRRSQSSTRIELARDLHDSLAQDLIGIGFKLDLLISRLPHRYKGELRSIRFDISEATNRVRKELFALRSNSANYQDLLARSAEPLQLEISGSLTSLNAEKRRIIDELVKNAAQHSKGRQVSVLVQDKRIVVTDDGMGLFGVSELVSELGGQIEISTSSAGTKVEINLP